MTDSLFQGSHILSTLLSLSSGPTTHAIARRALPTTSAALQPHINADSSAWPSVFSSLSPTPNVFFSALGTTRAAAGSIEKQRAIDIDLNLALARSAKESGVKTYVLISSNGSSASSRFPYMKMKGELEDEVRKLGFAHTVILRPGLIVGERENGRLAEALLRKVTNVVGAISPGFKDIYAQDADVIAKAAVNAGRQCAEGKKEEGVWILEQSDIVRLGRTEWKE